jgi:hypothetical protein
MSILNARHSNGVSGSKLTHRWVRVMRSAGTIFKVNRSNLVSSFENLV